MPGLCSSCLALRGLSVLCALSGSGVFDSLRPHGLQHAKPPCPSPTPRACSKSCPIGLVMPSNHLILCRPLLLLPSASPSIRVFSNKSVLLIRWPKYCLPWGNLLWGNLSIFWRDMPQGHLCISCAFLLDTGTPGHHYLHSPLLSDSSPFVL